MSTPYPPQNPPRRFERSRSNRVLGGVCAGLANYLNMDVTLVRVLTVVVSLFTGVPVVAYIVALFLVPEEPYAGPATTPGPSQATAPSDPVWGSGGAPWEPGTPGAAAPQPSPQPSPQPGPDPSAQFRGTSGSESTSESGPATAAPEDSGSVPNPEPVPETSGPEPEAGEVGSWESTPADPEEDRSTSSGETPPSGRSSAEGDKPAS
jgi:phage shock protein PspC (stress-responsive transcriptional regulator)